ncbi:MAG: flagellar hook protein FlgE [Acetobacteraceae bacterium]|nr:flagellar hook protein FlgE [Acetobacteraceae bacterium]
MSLFGAMNTAIAGLNAQSNAFGNISDNVANSQTVGFKRVDTSFVDYLTTSNTTVNDPGSVVARPDYVNNVQGTIAQTDNPLGLAITGQGFFAVSQKTGQANGVPTFNPQQYYTRAGDFQLDKNGYLVNSSGLYLNGWPVDPTTGTVNQNALVPIQVAQTSYSPVPTSQVTLSANLPATPASGTGTASSPISSNINVYDSLGTVHTVTLNWVQNSTDNWTVSVDVPDDKTTAARGSANVQFGSLGGTPVPEGTVGQISGATGSVTTSGYAAGAGATLSFTTDFGSGPQTIQLDLGTYGTTAGVTQYSGTQYDLRGISQNGAPPGSFTGVTTQANGSIVANFDNGKTQTIAQVPVVTFSNPDALQRQDGQSFTATTESGSGIANQAGSSTAGSLVTGSVESSNVDIAAELSKLIVAQQAYTANAKMVTTAQAMLTTTIDMKQ